VPETVLAQLGNRVQHALRAYTPREQKAVKTAADTFRPKPDFNCAQVITQLGTGEALVSTLEAKGIPSMVQRTLVRPPSSRLGPITPQERQKLIAESPVTGQYDQTIDRESAFEMLQKKALEAHKAEEQAQQQDASRDTGRSRWTIPGFGDDDDDAPARRAPRPRASNRQSVAEAAMKSVVRSVGSQVGRALVRGILGSLKKGF
jgi:DNA helicase HerA-like ATPase